MTFKINSDVSRFKDIIKNKIKNNLKDFISNENIIVQTDKKKISVPIDRIDLPHFVYKDGKGGVGQGEGNTGDPIDGNDKDKRPGKDKAGKGTDTHAYMADFTPEELAEILQEALNLPNLKPKDGSEITSEKTKYNSIRKTGSESLRHFKRTFRETLKREIASGTYQIGKPIIPIKDDKRYKSYNVDEIPENSAVVIYAMDVSGSMGDEQKFLVKSQVFWIDLWLKKYYPKMTSRFIVFDSVAKEVEKDEFFKIEEAGGTQISSAFTFVSDLIDKEHLSNKNCYFFCYSDGDNFDATDNLKCLDLLNNKLLPTCNLVGYGQVANGDFLDIMKNNIKDEKFKTTAFRNKSEILGSIKEFFK